jgi:CheY-like chemotaxis protein
MLCLSVKDTGVGISAPQLASLFQPLPMTAVSTSRHYGGSGMGLSICRKIVELMGGSIGAEGEPGRGSSFILTVTFGMGRRDDRESDRDKSTPVGIPNAESFRGAHILLVEDNFFNQQIAREQLNGLGINIEVARNGLEAVTVMAQRGDLFDGILMDIQMPVTDGYEATRLIRQTWSADRLPIIAMTAHAREQDREQCLQAGMNDHIAKPVAKADLFWCLARWVRTVSPPAGPPVPVDIRSDQYDELPNVLPGFAVAEGLARLNGNAQLYRKLIIAFSHDKQNRPEDIGTALAASDLHRAYLLAHGLRGVAENLAAKRLQAVAGAVCDACGQGDIETARLLLPTLAARMVEVTAAAALLEESIPSQEPELAAGEFAAKGILPLLHELGSLIDKHDLEALDHADRLKKLLAGSEYALVVARLAEALERIDFATASGFLESLTAHLAHLEEGHHG